MRESTPSETAQGRTILVRAFRGSSPGRESGHVASKRHGSGRVESGSVQNLTGRVGSGQEVFKSRGSGQVESRVFQISRVGSGRVGSTGNEKLTVRFRS